MNAQPGAPVETHAGRPILASDRRIQGSIDYGTFSGPPIVVDPAKYPRHYERLYDKVLEQCMIAGVVHRGMVMEAVFHTVRNALRYDVPETRALESWIAAGNAASAQQRIELSMYLECGVGTAREMALATGMMLEMLVDRGHIRGRVSVECDPQWDPEHAEIGGHQWVRYTNSLGKPFILDPAREFIGALDRSGRSQWNYARPAERESMMRHRGPNAPDRSVDHGPTLAG